MYYDFDWIEIFNHNRAILPRGQSLAHLVLNDCPEGKEASLLLTVLDTEEPCIRQTDEHYVVVVPIHDYIRNSGADAATTYYARMAGAPLTRLASLADADFSRSDLSEFLDANLDLDLLASWIMRSPDRQEAIRGIAEGTPEDQAIRALGNVTVHSPFVVAAIIELLRRAGLDGESTDLLEVIAATESGRQGVAETMASHLPQRISDTRMRLEEYQAMVDDRASTETDIQKFLEGCPWIVGLRYVRSRPRVEVPRGELDFVLDRFDGFFDIVELKGPRELLVEERTRPGNRSDRPQSPSAYSLSRALSNALAQAHHYRSILDQTQGLSSQYGLADTRQPRILIVIGHSDSLSETSGEILRELNLSLHRVEVIPYDVLGRRAEVVLDNVEALWTSTPIPESV